MADKVTAAKATANNIRIAPRKVRLVADMVRGQNVADAISTLRFANRGAAKPVEKVLMSAIANAEHNYDLNIEDLYVTEAYVNEGPTLKRFRPRAQGAASAINKRTSHITIVVSEKEEA